MKEIILKEKEKFYLFTLLDNFCNHLVKNFLLKKSYENSKKNSNLIKKINEII